MEARFQGGSWMNRPSFSNSGKKGAKPSDRPYGEDEVHWGNLRVHHRYHYKEEKSGAQRRGISGGSVFAPLGLMRTDELLVVFERGRRGSRHQKGHRLLGKDGGGLPSANGKEGERSRGI